MKKVSTKTAVNQVQEIEAFNSKRVDFSKFKSDLSTADLKKMFTGPGGVVIFPPYLFPPIETLSPAKTLGKGRTNLTIIMPTIVQVDATTPVASFNRQTTPSRNPIIQMHFDPSAYGITSVATYLMVFMIESYGQSTFNLTGFAGSGTLSNGGSKVVNGAASLTLVMQNVPSTQQVYGYVEQTSGAAWDWFSTQVKFPPLVFTE